MSDIRIRFRTNPNNSAEVEIGSFVDESGVRQFVQFDHDRPSFFDTCSDEPFTKECKGIKFFPMDERPVALGDLKRYLKELVKFSHRHNAEMKSVISAIQCSDIAHITFTGPYNKQLVNSCAGRRNSAYEASGTSLEERLNHIEAFLESRFS